ncbi:MAG: amidohydrolase, partial [Thermoplasmata archaeon]
MIGRGWDFSSLAESGWPTRRDLDRCVADRPAVLFHASGHLAVANSPALELLRIDRRSVDPPGGRLGRDRDGEPTGLLFEAAASGASRIAQESLIAEPELLRPVLEELPRWGLTAVGTMNAHPAEMSALRTLDARSPLPVRIRAYLGLRWWMSLDEPRAAAEISAGSRLTVAGVKAFADGAFGTRTAHLSAPYADAPTTSGMDVDSIEQMAAGFRRAHGHGIVGSAHALGDLGLEHALKAIERSRSGSTPAPDRIEHAGLVPPPMIERLRRLAPVVVVQPIFVWTDHWLSTRLGTERARWAYPLRSMEEAGIVLAGSSDAPFDQLDPWVGMRAATERADADGRSANPV